MNNYNENYYKTGNYVGYLEKYPRYIKLAEDVCDILKKTCILNDQGKVSWLDYGSGPGLFASALTKVSNCDIKISAYDISDWAIQELKRKKITVADLSNQSKYDIISFLDVLEHMSDNDIIKQFKNLSANILIIRIPVASEISIKQNKFHLDVSNSDATHINCKTKEMWLDLFNLIGYKMLYKLNLSNIYDSEGVFCAILTPHAYT